MEPPEEEEKKEPGLRIIEEAEVVRLEEKTPVKAPFSKPGLKPAPAPDFPQAETSRTETDARPEASPETPAHLLPVEDQWAETSRTARKTPMGWFFLLGLLLTAILGWGAWQAFQNEKPSATRQVMQKASLDEEAELREAEAAYQGIEASVRSYLAATTVEEKLRFVRHSARVKPLMENYYARNPPTPVKYRSIKNFLTMAIDNRPFTIVEFDTLDRSDDGNLLLEDTPDGVKVDWESDVAYQPMPFQEFFEKKPAEALDFRVYLTPDRLFTHEFADPSRYDCYFLTTRDSDTFLFGYVEKNSATATALREAITRPEGYLREVPALLSLRFPPNLKSPRGVLIEKVLNLRWAYTQDPTNPESK